MQHLSGSNRLNAPQASLLRIEWLDGVRALAAAFVVLHHIWLMSFGGYPANNGPWYSDWLVYGHLAVSVFIVVSGFSLSLSPAANNMRLKKSAPNFLRRRFWRIVPPYWAALAVSVILITSGAVSAPIGTEITARDVLVHALLFQDAVGSNPPNGVFWSIAVEWHIYFLFPVLLLLMRRYGPLKILPAVVVLVCAQHVAGQAAPALEWFDRFSTAYLALFAAGATAAWLTHQRKGAKASALTALLLTAGFLVAAGSAGTRWIVSQYFFIDLVVGIAAAAAMTAVAQGSLQWLTSLLCMRPLVFVGQFAFSLYLIHAPVLDLLRVHVVQASGLVGGDAFWMLAGLGIPASLAAAYLFFLLLERPFLTIRGFGQLIGAIRATFISQPIATFRAFVIARKPNR